MSADDLAKGFDLLEDEEVRAKVAGGDLSAFAALSLTDEESSLLAAAADNEAEVVGHSLNFSLGLGINAAKKGDVTSPPFSQFNVTDPAAGEDPNWDYQANKFK